MALIQQSNEIAAQLGEDEATICKIIQQADEAAAAVNIDGNVQGFTVLTGGFANRANGSLSVFASKKYAGHVWKDFPDPLTTVSGFAMSALSDNGVKAAVVYSSKNDAGDAFGWLVAFADTKATGRRIYGDCGPLDKFKNIDWDLVEKNLNNAGAIVNLPNLKAIIGGSKGKSVVTAIFSG